MFKQQEINLSPLLKKFKTDKIVNGFHKTYTY